MHDLGNPPFGHVGEEIIREWFKNNLKKINYSKDGVTKPLSEWLNKKQIADLENFEGNAQALRILSKTKYRSEINMPFSIISAMIKYPTRSDEIDKNSLIRHKMGCNQAEESFFLQIAKEVGTIDKNNQVIRHPLSYLVEAADDIAYMTADLEDAVKSGIISVEKLVKYLEDSFNYKITQKKYKGEYKTITKEMIQKLKTWNETETDKSKVMSEWGTCLRRGLMYVVCWKYSCKFDQILEGTFTEDMLTGTFHTITVDLLKEAMAEFVFDSRVITEPEITAQNILNFLLDRFVLAVIYLDDESQMSTQDKKVKTIISSHFLTDYEEAKKELLSAGYNENIEGELLYRRILIATDCISGMTDGYAKSLYKKLSGIE